MKKLGATIGKRNDNKTYDLINPTDENNINGKHASFFNRYTLCVNE